MKYLILIYASQRQYDNFLGKSGGGAAWSADDFAALATFMESFNQELVDSGELVDTRGLALPPGLIEVKEQLLRVLPIRGRHGRLAHDPISSSCVLIRSSTRRTLLNEQGISAAISSRL